MYFDLLWIRCKKVISLINFATAIYFFVVPWCVDFVVFYFLDLILVNVNLFQCICLERMIHEGVEVCIDEDIHNEFKMHTRNTVSEIPRKWVCWWGVLLNLYIIWLFLDVLQWTMEELFAQCSLAASWSKIYLLGTSLSSLFQGYLCVSKYWRRSHISWYRRRRNHQRNSNDCFHG